MQGFRSKKGLEDGVEVRHAKRALFRMPWLRPALPPPRAMSWTPAIRYSYPVSQCSTIQYRPNCRSSGAYRLERKMTVKQAVSLGVYSTECDESTGNGGGDPHPGFARQRGQSPGSLGRLV